MGTSIKNIDIKDLPLCDSFVAGQNTESGYLSLDDSKLVKSGVLYLDGFVRPVFNGGTNEIYGYNQISRSWEKLTTSTGGGLNFASSPVHSYVGYAM